MTTEPATLRAARKSAAEHLVDQGEFDFLMPFSPRRKLLTIAEVCGVLHRKRNFVEDMITEGKLEALAPQDRDVQRKLITRRSVLLLLAEQSLGDPKLFGERALKLLEACNRQQLDALIVRATHLRAKLPLES